MSVKVEGLVRAPPAKVNAYLADLSNWPKWQSDMQSVELVSGTRGKTGATYHYVAKAMGKSFDSTVKVVTADAGHVAFEGEWQGGMRPRGTFTTFAAEGGTLVTLNPNPECRGFMKLMMPLTNGMIRRIQKRHLDALRRELEAQA
ncbi:MAG: SRPBCC family protein [bacterium]